MKGIVKSKNQHKYCQNGVRFAMLQKLKIKPASGVSHPNGNEEEKPEEGQ
jgi:hypothetical protein